jgi:transposase
MNTIGKRNQKRGAPPRYDEAFKAGAVKMVVEQQRPCREVAGDLGICVDTLRNWLKAIGVQAGGADRQNREYRRMKELEAENRLLRKQLAEKSEAVEILKKSVGILSKP